MSKVRNVVSGNLDSLESISKISLSKRVLLKISKVFLQTI